MLKTRGKDKILKQPRWGKGYKQRNKDKDTADFSSGTVERREYNKTFNILKDENCLSKVLYPVKNFFQK